MFDFKFKKTLIFACKFLVVGNICSMDNPQRDIAQLWEECRETVARARQDIDFRRGRRLALHAQSVKDDHNFLQDQERDLSEEDNGKFIVQEEKEAIENESKSRLNAFYSGLNFLDKAFIIFFSWAGLCCLYKYLTHENKEEDDWDKL